MSIAAATAVHSWPRTAVETCVWFLLAAIALETWFLTGLAAPCRVVGDSMAETLLGVHREVLCSDCGHRFACGAQEDFTAPMAVCPNCGYAANDLESLPEVEGQRLLINRQAFSFRRPRRWEVVALRNPHRADEIVVKRVVGLPGETIEIRDGDVFANGAIQRKNLTEQHALAVLVHDAACRPTIEPAPPPRWRSDNTGSRWRPTDQGFSRDATTETEPTDWLVYHHWRRLASGQCEPSPVTDVCGYNQSRPRREENVHAAADLLLCFRLAEISGRGMLCIRADDGRDNFEIRLEFNGNPPRPTRYQAYRGGKPIAGAAGNLTSTSKEPAIEASLIDRQFLLALDGRTVFSLPYERTEPSQPSASPLAIGVQGLSAELRDLRVYRDVYYGRAIGGEMASDAALTPGPSPKGRGENLALAQRPSPKGQGEENYFVLGDNSPISEDSRTWPGGGGVDANLLLGKPLAITAIK